MRRNRIDSNRLAVIAAIFTIVGDIFALMSALAEFYEEQQNEEEKRRELENKIKYLQTKLDS